VNETDPKDMKIEELEAESEQIHDLLCVAVGKGIRSELNQRWSEIRDELARRKEAKP
jgi:hypothetical protein